MQRAPSHYDAASPAPGSLGPRRLLVVAAANPDWRGSCLLTARSSLYQAVDALTDPKPDVAVGPTEDGGYYLIGSRAPQPELCVEMPWSTNAVLRETITRAQRRGLRLVQLPCWHDVDTPADLDRLRAELAGTDESVAPHTRRFLQQSRPTGARTLGA